MPRISIVDEKLDYGIYDAEIFWVKQGILSRDAVRESRDEELVLDILLDLILRPMASSGSDYRNAAYSSEKSTASTSSTAVRTRLLTIGQGEVERRFMETLDLMKETLDSVGVPYATWTVSQQNPRGVPRYFHAHFVAIAQLMHDENMAPKSVKELSQALKNFWDKDLSIPGGGNWGSERKSALINAVKGYLQPYFEPVTDQHRVQLQEQALRFESTLRMALTEESLFELKQGFCKLDDPKNFDADSFDKILKISSAMANTRPGAKGVIFIGVADDRADAEAVKRFTGVEHRRLDRFYVTGTQHEIDAMGRSIDEHFRWLVDRIKNSKLETAFANRLAASLIPFRYKDYLLWKMEPEAAGSPVTYDGKFFVRRGPNTDQVSDPTAVIELVRRFPT
ncbi:ATP-binding protein [Micromonospora purpureochromogenes]|uniref:ATP-binding protein n=1 Tax=Micromonospora purpureochromogenes TaxID=47872 RepID=UPI00363F2BDA